MGIFQFLIFFLFLFSVHANTELRSLMELKLSLDPTNKVLDSWRNDGDPCSGSFVGVACNEHRKVANISLQGKGLSGKLSPAIAGLKCLSGLYLHYNSLSGEIPKQLSNLQELTDLYLNVNNLSGTIPPQIANMTGLQVVDLCCNQLTGNIPTEIGELKRLSVVSLQYNRLDGTIPASLGELGMLRRLDLSFNRLIGEIPATFADIPQLENLDVRNNTLYGNVPSGLKRLDGGFHGENNPGLCGEGFPTLRGCTRFDVMNNQLKPFRKHINDTVPGNDSETLHNQGHCNRTHCSNPSRFPRLALISGVITVGFVFVVVGSLAVFHYRRKKQKIGNTYESSDARLSTDQPKELKRNGSVSPLVTLEYSYGWDPLGDGWNNIGFSKEHLDEFRFNLEEIESATRCFSESNLLGKTNFSSVYKGVLRDGSLVAIRSINVTSCKSEEAEFVKGLYLLTSLRHENLVRLRGFCCSKGRGECFLVYDFASNGNLSEYLDVEDGGGEPNLDWPTRISIINGIATGIEYLHRSETSKPEIVHRNISVEKVLIDHQFKPLIADSGLHKILADDIVYSTLKVSAAMGYLAPEYVMTGRFTDKTDVFAFGVIVLQILSGKLQLTSSMRSGAESGKFEDFVDANLRGGFSESMAAKLGEIAIRCTNEHPDDRPSMEMIIKELNHCSFMTSS